MAVVQMQGAAVVRISSCSVEDKYDKIINGVRKMKKVVAYVTQTCPHCKTAKDFLRTNHIPYEEKDVNGDPQALKEFQMLKMTGVPSFLIGEEVMVGFNPDKLLGLLDFTVEPCPTCGKYYKVPKGKGKIKVTCKSCNTQFEKLT